MVVRFFPTLAFALALCVAGCGSGDEISRYKLVPVTGTVMHNGKPLEGAEVAFIPSADTSPSTAGSDRTGPDGNYKIIFHGRSGLAPGKYQAIIRKTILPPTGKSAALPEDIASDREMANLAIEGAASKRGSRRAAAPVIIEETFDREVSVDKDNVLDFDVRSTAKGAKRPR